MCLIVQSSKFIDKSAEHLPLAIYIDFKIWQRQSNIVKINIQTPYNYTFTSNIKQNYPNIPIGGFKWSGLGRETGENALENYSETKSIIINK